MADQSQGDIWEASTLDISKEDSFHDNDGSRGSPEMFHDEDRDDDRTPSPVPKEQNDPARVLQLSQSFFVADTEPMDDVSVMIPPTPSDVPFIVPSTPSDDCDKIEESQTLLDDKSSELQKELSFADDDDDDDEWDKPTQPMFTSKRQSDVGFDHKKSDPDDTYVCDLVSDEEYDDGPTQKVIPSDSNAGNSALKTQEQSLHSSNADKSDIHNTDAKLQKTSLPKEVPPFNDGYDDGPTQKKPFFDDEEHKSNDQMDDDDDDWHLRLTATEPTMSLDGMQVDLDAPTQKIERHEESKHTIDISDDDDDDDFVPKDENAAGNENDDKPDTKESRLDDKPDAKESRLDDKPDAKEISHESTGAEKSENEKGHGAELDNSKVESDDDDEIGPSQSSSRSGIHGETVVQDSPVRKEDKTLLKTSDDEVLEDKTLCIPSSSPEDETLVQNTTLVIGTEIQDTQTTAEKNDSEKVEIQDIQETNVLQANSILEKATKSDTTTTSDDSPSTPFIRPSGEFGVLSTYARTSKTPRRKPGVVHRMSTSSPAIRQGSTKNALGAPKADAKPWFLNSQKTLGSFTDSESLSTLLQTTNVPVDHEKIEAIVNKMSSSHEAVVYRTYVVYSIVAKDNTLYEKFSSVDNETALHNLEQIEISPINSNSTKSSFSSSPSTGRFGDISCSMSSKSHSSSSPNMSQQKATESLLSSQRTDSLTFQDVTSHFSAQNKKSIQNIKKSPTKGAQLNASATDDKKLSQDDFRSPQVTMSPSRSTKKGTTLSAEVFNTANKKSKAKKGKATPRGGAAAVKRSAAASYIETSTDDSEDLPVPKSKKGKYVKNLTSETSTPLTAQKTVASKKASTSGSAAKNQKKSTPEVHRKGGGRKKPASAKSESSDTEAAQRLQIPVPELAEDNSSDPAPFGSILPGVRVMARYNDGYYYPGVVQKQESDMKWCVLFDDNALHTIRQDSLLKIAVLQPGTKVHAMSSDNYYDPGVIISYNKEGGSVGYVVEHANGITKRYPRKCVILSSEQGRHIINTRPTPPANLTINLGKNRSLEFVHPDNIIGGKRKRKSTQDPNSSDQATAAKQPTPNKNPKTSKRTQKPKTKVQGPDSSNTNTTNAASEQPPDTMDQEDKTTKTLPAPQPKSKQKKGKKKAQKKVATTSAASAANSESKRSTTELPDEDKTRSTESAVPVGSTKLFQGYAFLLSQAEKKPEPLKEDSDDDSEVETPDDVKPYDKETLCAQITSGGGIVLDTFEEAMKCTQKKLFLLANTYLRTIKYLQCVSANIPCIKYQWVYNCTTMKKTLVYTAYLLPTGHSIIKDETVFWHRNSNIFNGLKIVLTADKKKNNFVNIWMPVMAAAKAEVVQKWNSSTFTIPGTTSTVDVIITDSSCPNAIVAAAKKKKIPVVSIEWFIQCIIEGSQLPYDAHPKFKHFAE